MQSARTSRLPQHNNEHLSPVAAKMFLADLPERIQRALLAHAQETQYPLEMVLEMAFTQCLYKRIAFGIQQACEGLVWVGMEVTSSTQVRLGAFGFLAFAYWFWLFWAPLSVAIAETNLTMQRVGWSLGVLGFGYGALLYLPLIFQPDWLAVQVVHHSIEYDTRLIFDPWFSQEVDRLVYALIILIPFALASNPALKGFGATIALSAIASHWLLHQVFVSVWCFFAAILSLLIVWICQSSSTVNRQQDHGSIGRGAVKANADYQ